MTAALLYYVEVDWLNVQSLYFFDFLYFLMVTMTTVGLGDVVMLSVLGRAVAGIFVISVLIYLPTRFAEMDALYGGLSEYNTRVESSDSETHIIICGQIEGNIAAVRELLYELHNEQWQLRAAFPTSPSTLIDRGFYEKRELANLQFNVRKTVIMDSREPSKEVLNLMFSSPFFHRLKYVRGSFLNPDDLNRVGFKEALSVFFITSHSQNCSIPDRSMALGLLSIRNACPTLPIHVLSLSPSVIFSLTNMDSMVQSISLDEMRSIFMASCVRTPGLPAFALNLLRSPLLPPSMPSDSLEEWEKEYSRASRSFLTTLIAPAFMDGHSFTDIAKAFYMTSIAHTRILVGVEEILAARGTPTANSRLERLSESLCLGFLTSSERHSAEYFTSLEVASHKTPLPGHLLLNPGPQYKVRAGQVLYVVHGGGLVDDEESYFTNFSLEQQLSFNMKLDKESRGSEDGYGFPYVGEIMKKTASTAAAVASYGGSSPPVKGRGSSKDEDTLSPSKSPSPPPRNKSLRWAETAPPSSALASSPSPHHSMQLQTFSSRKSFNVTSEEEMGWVRVGDSRLEVKTKFRALNTRGQKNALSAVLSHDQKMSQYSLPLAPDHPSEGYVHHRMKSAALHSSSSLVGFEKHRGEMSLLSLKMKRDSIRSEGKVKQNPFILIICDILEAPLAIWPLRMSLRRSTASGGRQEQGGEGAAAPPVVEEPPDILILSEEPRDLGSVVVDPMRAHALEYLYKAGGVYVHTCHKITFGVLEEVEARSSQCILLKPIPSYGGGKSHRARGERPQQLAYQDIVFTYISMLGIIQQSCAISHTSPPTIFVDSPTLEEIEAMEQSRLGVKDEVVGGSDLTFTPTTTAAAAAPQVPPPPPPPPMPQGGDDNVKIRRTLTLRSFENLFSAFFCGGLAGHRSRQIFPFFPNTPPPPRAASTTLARRLLKALHHIPPSLPYFSPMYTAGTSFSSESLGSLVAANFLEPATLPFLFALLLPWKNAHHRAPWSTGSKLPAAATPAAPPPNSATGGVDADGTPPPLGGSSSPSSPFSSSTVGGGGGGMWGSACVELVDVPPEFHGQPYRRLFSDYLGRRAGPTIILGLLRCRFALGAPADYPIVAPHPGLLLFSKDNGGGGPGGAGGNPFSPTKQHSNQKSPRSSYGDRMYTLVLSPDNAFRAESGT